jgi:hypothetical protein
MKKSIGSYTALILTICLVCAGCDASKQSAQPRKIQLPKDATHLDFSWPAIIGYDVEPIVFRIPREKLDVSRIRLNPDGNIQSVYIILDLKDFPVLEREINSPLRDNASGNKKQITYGYILRLNQWSDTREAVERRFQFNVTRRKKVEDGTQGGLARYTLVECFLPEQISTNIDVKEKILSKPSYDTSPDGCFLNRDFIYLTNMNSIDALSDMVDVDCNSTYCTMRITVDSRMVYIELDKSDLDFSSEIAKAAKSQIHKFIVNRGKI